MVEKIVSGFFLLLSLTYLFLTMDLAFGSVFTPKAGFFPTLVGVGASGLALINFIQVLNKDVQKEKQSDTNLKKMLLFFSGLLVYILILNLVGYMISSFLAMLFLLKITGIKGWRTPLIISVCVALGFYMIFVILLGVNLP